MRIRIGGRDPRFKNIGGRDMHGIARMFQLFVSLQILFGSRRGLSLLGLWCHDASDVGDQAVSKAVADGQSGPTRHAMAAE